jgi:glycosidase
VQQLTRLHKEHLALQQGEQVTLASADNYYAFLRSKGNDRLLVVFNASASEQTIELARADTPLNKITSAATVLDAKALRMEADKLTVPMAPMSVAIYSLK